MAKNKRYFPKKDTTKKTKNKKKYKLRNWKEYNETLVNRGRIDVWVEKGILEKWYSKPTGKPGAQRKYTDKAVGLTLRFGQVFHQKLRQTEGLVKSVFIAMGMKLEVPDHSTLSRRGETITVELPKEHREIVTIIVDSSGLKVYGEGEWKVRKHGYSKLKFHPRDENLRAIRKSSRKKWKENIGYHVRSIGENVYFRWKTIFGDKLNARKTETQETEAAIKASILNKMRMLGMPDSYAVS